MQSSKSTISNRVDRICGKSSGRCRKCSAMACSGGGVGRASGGLRRCGGQPFAQTYAVSCGFCSTANACMGNGWIDRLCTAGGSRTEHAGQRDTPSNLSAADPSTHCCCWGGAVAARHVLEVVPRKVVNRCCALHEQPGVKENQAKESVRRSFGEVGSRGRRARTAAYSRPLLGEGLPGSKGARDRTAATDGPCHCFLPAS